MAQHRHPGGAKQSVAVLQDSPDELTREARSEAENGVA